ncbi:MAG: 5-formyltetrahydrofolate cyclo-ligase [Propionibacteriaceae bacterium]|jgi:5-formyltetrahydrofolate cyclo-ligase|nr:5-formyltetrahydrofolate cyclo-ligase [Propionibacteriaceae bacterium]
MDFSRSAGATGASKAELRASVERRRAALDPAERADRDNRRAEVFRAALDEMFGPPDLMVVVVFAPLVAMYWSVPPEPDTHLLMAELRRRHSEILLPVISPRPGLKAGTPAWADLHLGTREARWDALKPSLAGLREPTSDGAPEDLGEADLIVLPGLAGTLSGHRLGTGGGWYDRALLHSQIDVPRWLLLNDDEVVSSLPIDPWDERVDAIVTQSRFIDCTV